MNSRSEVLDLDIPADLAEKMDRALILTEDACRTILHCEQAGHKLLDDETGDYIGHLKHGALTYWVRYRHEDARYQLVSIYCHRADLTEDTAL